MVCFAAFLGAQIDSDKDIDIDSENLSDICSVPGDGTRLLGVSILPTNIIDKHFNDCFHFVSKYFLPKFS